MVPIRPFAQNGKTEVDFARRKGDHIRKSEMAYRILVIAPMYRRCCLPGKSFDEIFADARC
jgi:hypothetical protein